MISHYRYQVAPFGDPRIVVCLRLPEAFRRLLRPSSALYAKTSAVRSFSFNHTHPSSDGATRTVNQVFPFSVQTCLIFVFTTFQKDLSVFLSVIQFSKNNLELPLFQVIPQNRTGISNVGKTSFLLLRVQFSP